jgi:hypothetical protein
MGSESFDHTGYLASAQDLKALRTSIKRCPTPGNWRCKCPAHRELGNKDASGRWAGLQDLRLRGTFALKL